MTACTIDLARPDDDAALRSLLAATPMPGAISIAFAREPSFFDAQSVAGSFHQTLVARCGSAIVGMGERSIRSRFVNGREMPIGYLGSLRLLDAHRGAGALARGFRLFNRLHQDRRTPFYLTTIVHDNANARSLLTSGRVGLPTYQLAGNYHTFAIPLRRARAVKQNRFNIRPALDEDRPAILDHLQRCGSRRQFFPALSAEEFPSQSGTFRNLQMADLLLAFDGASLVGTLGAWDQHLFRQERICAYSPLMGAIRPVYNLWADLRGLPRLPTPGSTLRSLRAALCLAERDDPDIFLALLQTVLCSDPPNHGTTF